MTRPPLSAVATSAAAVGLALLLGACGSNRPAADSPPTSTHGRTAPSVTGQGGVNPNAQESNPPGDIPDNQAFVTFTSPSAGFTVKVPEGWARSGKGTAVTFTDKLNSVGVQSTAASSAPTAASAASSELPAISAASHNLEPRGITTVRRNAGNAILLTYRVDSAADPVTGKVVRDAVERYEFWNPATRTEAVLTLAGPVGADNVDPWRTVTDSFRWRR